MKFKNRLMALALAVGGAVVLSGCESGGSSTAPEGGEGGATVSLSIAMASGGGSGSAALAPAFDIAQDGEFLQTDDAGNELVLTRVDLVLREIELERLFKECPEDSGIGDNDACEKFETAPTLFTLDLGGGASQVVTTFIGEGVYDELEFDVHKVGDDPEDLEFLALHPTFEDVSIRVTGRFNDNPFVYENDFNEEQETELFPPLEVSPGQDTNLTMVLDLGTWFVRSDGRLVDPLTANKGGPNENLVRNNIRDSIEGTDAFEDRDHRGRR